MTLGRQLLIGIVVAFAALLIGIEAIYVHTARRHLADQLDASANETATSLALSIGSRMPTLDASLVNTIVNPVFDRGYFSLIEVRAADGSPVFTRRLESVEIEQPPGWFVALAAFEPVTGNSLVSAGWKQLGRVIVQPHPQFAYAQLWETALATLAWLVILFAIGLIGIRIYLAGILRPLQQIESAAMSIGERRFVLIETLPKSRELLRVTQAINSLSSKVRDAIAQESANAERLRREAFEDTTTGKLNRRGFETAAAAAIADSAEVFAGTLTLATLAGLEEANRSVGMSRANELLANLADALVMPDAPGRVIVGRWQGPTFAAFVANGKPEATLSWAGALSARLTATLRSAGLPEAVCVRAGVAHYEGGGSTLASLGRHAEEALAAAAPGSAGLARDEAATPLVDLKAEVEAALAADRIAILYQKVVALPEPDVLHYEFFSKLVDSQGNQIPAGAFIPVASQHGLLPALDRRGVELALGALGGRSDLPPLVALNISLQSILDGGFREGLQYLLRAHPREARRLVFEITGAAAAKSPDACRAFASELRRAGSRLAFDNFEMDRNALATAHDLMPAYMKLSPAYTRELKVREDARFILEAMLRVFRPLEIPVIAQGVEDESLAAVLAELGVAGYQGYVLGKPAALPG